MFVDVDNGCVFRVDKNGKYIPLAIFECHRGYRWFRLHYKCRRRGVSVHRAVWMAFHNEPIPKRREVHHKFGKREGDGISNLECMTVRQHREKHRSFIEMNGSKEFVSAWDQ